MTFHVLALLQCFSFVFVHVYVSLILSGAAEVTVSHMAARDLRLWMVVMGRGVTGANVLIHAAGD